MVVELFAIVCLQASNRSAELSANESMKTNECGEHLRFLTQGKGPNKVGVIIKNGKIISITRVAYNR